MTCLQDQAIRFTTTFGILAREYSSLPASGGQLDLARDGSPAITTVCQKRLAHKNNTIIDFAS